MFQLPHVDLEQLIPPNLRPLRRSVAKLRRFPNTLSRDGRTRPRGVAGERWLRNSSPSTRQLAFRYLRLNLAVEVGALLALLAHLDRILR